MFSSYVHGLFPWIWKFHAAHGVMRIYEELKRQPHLRAAQEDIARQVLEEEKAKQKK